jgi:heme exporter protein D|tara:strand:+ start:2570 stop:2785 length:216 start_codon:yes stop_codon:yes gene_type:complete
MLDAIQFSSWAEFFDMGGYGFNVWSVYALFAILIAVNLILPWRKKQRIVRQLKRRLTLDAEIQSEDDSNGE